MIKVAFFTESDQLKFINCAFIFLFVSCSSIQNLKEDRPLSLKEILSRELSDDQGDSHIAKAKEGLEQESQVEEIVRDDEVEKLKESMAPTLGSKLTLNYKKKHYDFWVDYFLKRGRDNFQSHLYNSEDYKEVVFEVLSEYGLPKELFYVGLIESGYNSHIRSRASAVGPWQFMKGTAKHYGLRVDSSVDERRNIHKATEAAARYFTDLYNIFGSWELALCGYNAGEYRIIRAIRKGNTRHYKSLVKKGLIPKETIHYIPKIAAARYIEENRENYSFKYKNKNDSKVFVDASFLKIPKSFDLKKFSEVSGISLKRLKKLNPDIDNNFTRVYGEGHRLVIPKSFESKVASLDLKSIYSSPYRKIATATYTVRRGDTLSEIAARSSMSLSQLRSVNNIRGNRIYVGQKLKVSSQLSSGQSQKITTYKVRRGDHLTGIAKKYGVSLSDIRSLNNIQGSKIFIGQTLKLRGQTKSHSGKTIRHYRVRKGDYLGGIARQFGMRLSRLKSLNSLRGNRIYVGQKLKVDPVAVKTYVVKRGDNLIEIAKRFNSSISKIMVVNSLDSEMIYPNQKLHIPSES